MKKTVILMAIVAATVVACTNENSEQTIDTPRTDTLIEEPIVNEDPVPNDTVLSVNSVDTTIPTEE